MPPPFGLSVVFEGGSRMKDLVVVRYQDVARQRIELKADTRFLTHLVHHVERLDLLLGQSGHFREPLRKIDVEALVQNTQETVVVMKDR